MSSKNRTTNIKKQPIKIERWKVNVNIFRSSFLRSLHKMYRNTGFLFLAFCRFIFDFILIWDNTGQRKLVFWNVLHSECFHTIILLKSSVKFTESPLFLSSVLVKLQARASRCQYFLENFVKFFRAAFFYNSG